MAKNKVFANGREVACKAGKGKVIASFPDVCFTPPDKVPPTPPGVPIPYPLFSKAKDTNKGTKRVMVSKKEVMKRDSSNFKKCKGDEAAKTAKKGIISSKLTGKVFFTSWSMNVKVEKKSVVRHLDITGSNHGSPANCPTPIPYLDSAAISSNRDTNCEDTGEQNQDHRAQLKEKTKDKTLVGPNGEGKGTTVSSMAFNDKSTTAHSRKRARDKVGSFAEGGLMAKRRRGESSLCAEAEHIHGKPHSQKSGHAEAKLLDELFTKNEPSGGKATFNIDWINKDGRKSKMPCPDCHAMMCAAEKCGVEVYICDKKGNSHRVPCSSDRTRDQRELKKLIGEIR